ncbi:transcription initiation at TATA-containing promoter protein [Coniosporium apollinis]|uniref:Transcription initiation at TATA-containing promoter protein n=2 Tax=Coniosporium TaxID=2810619 RepID=A0ABQ9NPY0_9PEZI|nr:transcription initiation at TATA-containing promoter protein [Cladosporium sp. JES 115]KAJ9661252.1 transcription initiation at TATA-containing promoter protein [Coniosporium apollinis]
MTTPSLDQTFIALKTQPVPSSDEMALDSTINGTAHHHDPLFDDDAPSGDNAPAAPAPEPQLAFVTHNSEAATTNGATDPASPPVTAPVTDVTSGIAPVADFIPDKSPYLEPSPNVQNAGATNSSVPPAIDLPTPEMREDTTSIPAFQPTLDTSTAMTPSPSAHPVEAAPPSDEQGVGAQTGGAPEGTVEDTKPVATGPDGSPGMDLFDSGVADIMDTSDDVASARTANTSEIPHRPADESLFGGDGPASPKPVPQMKNGDQDMNDVPSSGQVRRRQDDEEDNGRSPKRSKISTEPETASEFQKPDLPASAGASLESGTTATTAQAPQASPSYDSLPMTGAQQKWLLEKLRTAKKIKDALPFLKPVDPVALNIPSYPHIIKNPMDISTMEQKLKDHQYNSADDFISDLNLMVQNCVTFNGPQHVVSYNAYNFKAYMDKAMMQLPSRDVTPAAAAPKKAKKLSVATAPKPPPRRESRGPGRSPTGNAAPPPNTFALDPNGVPLIRRDSSANDGRPKREIHRPPPRDLPYSSAKPKKKKYQLELKFCEMVMNEITKRKHQGYSYPFLQPVDPVALNIPTYHKIIKKPMDLGTIGQKLKGGQYTNAKEFKADIDLMFDNCYKFNPESDGVHKMGKAFQAIIEELWATKDQWLEDHAPASEPPSPASGYSDEEDESEVEQGTETEKLAQIQRQIMQLTGEAEKIISSATKRASPKAASKRSGKASRALTKVKRSGSTTGLPSTAKANSSKPRLKTKTTPITYAQKQEISDSIGTLEESQMRKAVQIIKNGCPDLQTVNDDELELDIDAIPEPVLHELLKFIRKIHPPMEAAAVDDDYEPPMRSSKTATTKPRKNKPMGKHEQEANIARIQDQLKTFPGAYRQSPEPAPKTEESSSGDDADSGSESEEE